MLDQYQKNELVNNLPVQALKDKNSPLDELVKNRVRLICQQINEEDVPEGVDKVTIEMLERFNLLGSPQKGTLRGFAQELVEQDRDFALERSRNKRQGV